MVALNDILKDVQLVSVKGSADVFVTSVQTDSRKVEKSCCFVAVKGMTVDGHQYIGKAIAMGAGVIVCEVLPAELKSGVTYVQVKNSAVAAGEMVHHFFGDISGKIRIVGVTGTNGKTTVTTLLHKLFTALGYHCGLIGTVQNIIGKTVMPSRLTTPDVISLNELIDKMYESGCTYIFMEVSSIAIHQHRVEGIRFSGAIFTNITHDHLDYHRTFEEYVRVKKLLFDSLPVGAFALSNADDRRGLHMLRDTAAGRFVYSLLTMADFKGKILDNSLMGLQMTVNDTDVHFKLIGGFNAYNLMAVFGAAICLGQNKEEVLEKLSVLDGAEGRFDYTVSPKDKIISIVDYAHTPDALLNVLATIKKLRGGNSQIITVVGCGGDRDHTKRPEMAEVACEYSDRIFFTSDNPRTEDPAAIIRDIEKGIPLSARKKCISITDRREAIKAAVTMAQPGDILLVAGKGHEKYQEVNGKRHHFDDKEVLADMFQLLDK